MDGDGWTFDNFQPLKPMFGSYFSLKEPFWPNYTPRKSEVSLTLNSSPLSPNKAQRFTTPEWIFQTLVGFAM